MERPEINRFEQALPPRIAERASVEIIGVGAVGSRIVELLSKFGVSSILMWDTDTVQPENVGVAAHGLPHVGMLKVDAAKQIAADNCAWDLSAYRFKFADTHALSPNSNIVIAAVDNMETRRTVFKKFRFASTGWEGQSRLWIDPRMGFDECEVYAVSKNDTRTPGGALAAYEESAAFDAEPAPCGQHSMPTTAMICASMAVDTIAAWLRGDAFYSWSYYCLKTRESEVGMLYDGKTKRLRTRALKEAS